MVTKKQLLQLAQVHLAKNEEDNLTCYICIAIDRATDLTIQELEKRTWWQKLLKPTKVLKTRQMRWELQVLVESITGGSFKLADAERILPGFNNLEVPEGYSPRQFARHLLLRKLVHEH